MNFLSILTIVFCGRTVLINADFWVEFRGPTPSSSRTEYPTIADYLYECKTVPTGMPAFRAAEFRCTPVTSRDGKIKIHLTCNFYSVFKPTPRGQKIQFSGHRLSKTGIIWYVGYRNNAIDHMIFAEPPSADVLIFRGKLEEMEAIVPPQAVNSLAGYLAQTNIISSSGLPLNLNYSAFATFLQQITQGYANINQGNPWTVEELREKYGAAMKLALMKMIDPCTVIRSDSETAVQYCVTYCNFLTAVARHFRPVSARCSSLRGGHCVSMICTCFVQAMPHPFVGCQTASPMQLCNNLMRAKLNLFFL